jgi:hypothetical protein
MTTQNSREADLITRVLRLTKTKMMTPTMTEETMAAMA